MTPTSSRSELGRWAEELAARHLEAQGYAIVERNFRTRFGEVDLVARREDVLAFVEVKAVRTLAAGHPLERVGARKRARLGRLALAYVTARRRLLGDPAIRFDVVAVVAPDGPDSPPAEFVHLEDAFRP